MRVCNPREGWERLRAGWRRGSRNGDGQLPDSWAQESVLEQMVIMKQREERISPRSRWSEIATKLRKGQGVGLGIGWQMRLHRYSSIWGRRWCLWGYTRSYGEQKASWAYTGVRKRTLSCHLITVPTVPSIPNWAAGTRLALAQRGLCLLAPCLLLSLHVSGRGLAASGAPCCTWFLALS